MAEEKAPSLVHPLHIRRMPGGFKVDDDAGRTVAYIYGREAESEARAANVWTMPEAEEIARMIARALSVDGDRIPVYPARGRLF